jgi:iron complex outermembrane recepter protein
MNRSELRAMRRAVRVADATSCGRQELRFASVASAVSAVLAGVPIAYAQQENGALQEVIVTAQKRAENEQSVPISLEVLNARKLEELNVVNLDGYVEFLPGVSYVRNVGDGGGNGQPGTAHVYMRGVASGGDGNPAGPLPSVGTYLDEQPVTTIVGTVDVHLYDIARIEVLEGPQGTLFGASSEAGTIRIITNKPDLSGFKAGYDVGVNSVDHGGIGYVSEGFVNIPISPIAAVRLVGWDEHDAGFISNVPGTNASAGIVDGVRTFPTWNAANGGGGVVGAGAISNAAYVKNDFNTVDTWGGRGALKLDLGDNWTVTPTFMGQSVEADGFFGYDPTVGDLDVVRFGAPNSHDSWTQAALTVEGDVSNFDIVYASAYMTRDTHALNEYSDYSYFYDKYFGSGSFWVGNNGKPIMPQQFVIGRSHFTKWSNELRVSTPQNLPVKGTMGIFAQRQVHDIWQQYTMPGLGGDPFATNPQGLASNLIIPGVVGNTIWLTDEQRVDTDSAAFGQLVWDIDSHWSVTGGIRFYRAKTSLQGFFGYSANYEQLTGFNSGMLQCGPPGGAADITYEPFKGAPCTDLNQSVEDTGNTPLLNLTYKFDPDHLVYATYSKGFRPGGVNRSSAYPPFKAEYLTNYEAGWKTEWLDHRVRWNGAVFWEDWNDFQFSFIGENSVTIVANGGAAQIKGVESNLDWVVGGGWTLASSLTLIDAKLTSNYCGTLDASGQPITNCPTQQNSFSDGITITGPLAPAGTTLPITPKFKGNAIVRYTFRLMNWDAHAQAAQVYQDATWQNLRLPDRQALGENPPYGLFNLSTGIEKHGLSLELVATNLFDKRASLTRFVACQPTNCTQPYIIPTQPRTVALMFAQKF